MTDEHTKRQLLRLRNLRKFANTNIRESIFSYQDGDNEEAIKFLLHVKNLIESVITEIRSEA